MKRMATGLDIGTTKICAALSGVAANGEIEVLGVGVADAKGINKGFVSHLDKLVDSINKAVQAAEEKAGVKAHHIVTNISGSSVTAALNESSIPLSRRGREVTKRDIEKIIETTKNISLTLEEDFLFCCPHEFIVDDHDGVEDPQGLYGTKLKVRLYVITALANHIQNISKAVRYAGYELFNIVPTSVASASGILDNEQRHNGAIVIDIGGGITELAILSGGLLRYFNSVNVGGMDLTACLSAHLKIPFENAELIKRRYGSISKEDLRKDEKNIFDIGTRRITVNTDQINNILKERLDEIFHILKERLAVSDYFQAPMHSLVVTGGSALLHGALESCEHFFEMPAKMGRVKGINGDPSILANPAYSAAISLAQYGMNKYKSPYSRSPKGKSFLLDTYYRFRDTINEYF